LTDSSQNIDLLSWITMYMSLRVQCHFTENILSWMSSWWLRRLMQAYWSPALLCWWVGRCPFSHLNIDWITSFLRFDSAARIMWFEADTNGMTVVSVTVISCLRWPRPWKTSQAIRFWYNHYVWPWAKIGLSPACIIRPWNLNLCVLCG